MIRKMAYYSKVKDKLDRNKLKANSLERVLNDTSFVLINEYEQWMKDYIEKKRKPATINGYWSYYKNWIMPYHK